MSNNTYTLKNHTSESLSILDQNGTRDDQIRWENIKFEIWHFSVTICQIVERELLEKKLKDFEKSGTSYSGNEDYIACVWWPISPIRNYQFELKSEFETEFEIKFESEFESEFKIEVNTDIEPEFEFEIEFKVAIEIVFPFVFPKLHFNVNFKSNSNLTHKFELKLWTCIENCFSMKIRI